MRTIRLIFLLLVIGASSISAQSCEELSLAPGDTVEVEFAGKNRGRAELETDDDGFILWAWPSSTAVIIRDGHEVERLDNPVPDIPSGQTVSGFIRGGGCTDVGPGANRRWASASSKRTFGATCDVPQAAEVEQIVNP